MATIYNSDLSKELIDGAKIQVSKDAIPTQLAEKVVPVMEVNPKLLRRANIVKNSYALNTTSATIYATPADKDFYLTSATLALIKDATATSVSSRVNIVVDGLTIPLLFIPSITLTAQTLSVSNSYANCPIKVDRGTNITVTNSTNVANATAGASITGYLVENVYA